MNNYLFRKIFILKDYNISNFHMFYKGVFSLSMLVNLKGFEILVKSMYSKDHDYYFTLFQKRLVEISKLSI